MKKLFVIGMSLCFSICAFAASTRTDTLKKWQTKLTTLKTDTSKAGLEAMIAIFKADFPTTEAQFNNIIAPVKTKYPAATNVEDAAIMALYSYGKSCTSDDYKLMYDLAVKYNNTHILIRLIVYYKQGDQSVKNINNVLYTYFNNDGNGATKYEVTKFQDRYFKTLVSIDDATAKTQLKTLNRIYSQKLIANKTDWEAFVARIRTCLETY